MTPRTHKSIRYVIELCTFDARHFNIILYMYSDKINWYNHLVIILFFIQFAIHNPLMKRYSSIGAGVYIIINIMAYILFIERDAIIWCLFGFHLRFPFLQLPFSILKLYKNVIIIILCSRNLSLNVTASDMHWLIHKHRIKFRDRQTVTIDLQFVNSTATQKRVSTAICTPCGLLCFYRTTRRRKSFHWNSWMIILNKATAMLRYVARTINDTSRRSIHK